jgi:hypothetical protein
MNENEKQSEDYSIIEKILMTLFWFREMYIGDWFLKRDGYTTKYKSRIICIITGMALYAILILCNNL